MGGIDKSHDNCQSAEQWSLNFIYFLPRKNEMRWIRLRLWQFWIDKNEFVGPIIHSTHAAFIHRWYSVRLSLLNSISEIYYQFWMKCFELKSFEKRKCFLLQTEEILSKSEKTTTPLFHWEDQRFELYVKILKRFFSLFHFDELL